MADHERHGGSLAGLDHRVGVAQVAGDWLFDKHGATLSCSGLNSQPVLWLWRGYNHRVELTPAFKKGLDARIRLCAQFLGNLSGHFRASVHHAGNLRVRELDQ
jgi:hypothetical protein